MVANYPNAQVFYPSDPVGIDAAILILQQTFASKLGWLEKAFGRCTAQKETRTLPNSEKKVSLIYPEVYQAHNEPMDARPNDNFRSYCFFNVHDPGKIIDYDPFDPQSMMTRDISIIFWGNLTKIDISQTGRFNEALIISVLQALKNNANFIPKQTFERFDHVFQEFTIGDDYSTYMKHPFTGFRITGELSYPAIPENVCID